MGWGAPLFFAGLAVLSIPIYAHLLRQFTRTPKAFPSLRFFERRTQSATKHRRLRYLTLLSLRLLLFGLVVLAFANPFRNSTSTTTHSNTLAVIAIDQSFSMRAAQRLVQAKSQAQRFLQSVPHAARAQIFSVTAQTSALSPPELDRGLLTAAIESIQPTDGASSFAEFARMMRSIESSTGMKLDVHLFTDAQQTSMPTSFADLQMGPHTQLQVHRIGDRALPNWAVLSADVPAEIHDSNGARISARIAGWNVTTATRSVSVLVDGKLEAEKNVTISDCGSVEVVFEHVNIPFGVHRGEIRISPEDDLPGDDSYWFSVNHRDKEAVLFIYGRDRDREPTYYGAALTAGNTGLKLETQSLNAAIGNRITSESLKKYSFVVLNDPAPFNPDLESALGRYVERGGAVLLAAGPRTARYGKIPLIENQLRGSVETQGAGWRDGSIPAFGQALFIAAGRILPGSHDEVLARLTDGSPLLLRRSLGQGQVLVFATTLDNTGGDFPLHSSFVPFVQESARMLTGEAQLHSSYVAGAAISLRKDISQSTAAEVLAPDGSHPLSLFEATRALTYQAASVGFYDVRRADGKRMLIGVNSDRRESDLTPTPDETLALWNGAPGSANDSIESQAEMQRIPLWPYLVTCALLVGVVESVIARRYLSQTDLGQGAGSGIT